MRSATKLRESFSPDFEILRITEFLKSALEGSGAKGFVVGLSGGIDSAVVASLCVKAVGPRNVWGVLLFEDDFKDSVDYSDAKKLTTQLEVNSIELAITPIIEAMGRTLKTTDFQLSKITKANVKARTRMIMLYAIANEKNLLVAGTGDKSEDMIGYFTKYGDGGVDILPIAHLYKTEVRLLGKELGVTTAIVCKPSSPNLWKGHKATDEIPADYDILDRVLTMLYDSGSAPSEVSKKTGLSPDVIDKVLKLNLRSRHKRQYPSMVTSW